MFAYQPLQASPSPVYQQAIATRQPFYITFREHYCFSPSVPVPLPDDENIFKHGFLPQGCRFIDIEVGIFTSHTSEALLNTTSAPSVGWSQHHGREAFIQCVL